MRPLLVAALLGASAARAQPPAPAPQKAPPRERPAPARAQPAPPGKERGAADDDAELVENLELLEHLDELEQLEQPGDAELLLELDREEH